MSVDYYFIDITNKKKIYIGNVNEIEFRQYFSTFKLILEYLERNWINLFESIENIENSTISSDIKFGDLNEILTFAKLFISNLPMPSVYTILGLLYLYTNEKSIEWMVLSNFDKNFKKYKSYREIHIDDDLAFSLRKAISQNVNIIEKECVELGGNYEEA